MELVHELLQRISIHDLSYHSFLHVTSDAAIAQAREKDSMRASHDAKAPLFGVPGAIKDMICTKGVPTTAASHMLGGYLPPYNATVIERLQRAGYLMLGKTNCDEYALGTSNESSAYGPVKNPWDLTRAPGGSSGGSAAAVAAGLAPFALGTDTGGSIRQPSSLSGVVGLKPSYGRVSRYGAVALASSLDQIGVLTKTVADAEIIFNVINGIDPLDATTVDCTDHDRAHTLKPLSDLVIGIPKEYVGSMAIDAEGIELGVRERFRESIAVLTKLGARMVEISLPHTSYACAVYQVLMASELSSNLARFDGIRYGTTAIHPKSPPATIASWYAHVRGKGFGPETKRRVLLGTYTLSSGYYDAYYRRAQQVRTLLIEDFKKAFAGVDLIACPTSPTVAFKLGAHADDPIAMHLADIFTLAMNLAGLPAMSVPCGFAPAPDDPQSSLPVGLQLIGNRFDEATIFSVGKAFQDATDHHLKMPPVPHSSNP